MSETLDTSGEPQSPTVESAQRQILEIRMDPAHPFNIPNDPRRPFAVKKMERLYETIDRVENPKPPEEKPLLPEIPGVTFDTPRLNAGVRRMERLGFSHTETGDLLRYIATRTRAIASGKEEMPDRQATEATLKAEWGDGYPRKVLGANLIIETLDYDTRQHLERTQLGNDPRLIRRLAAAGARLLVAFDRKVEIMADPDFFGHLGTNMDRHRALVKELEEITKKLAGEMP